MKLSLGFSGREEASSVVQYLWMLSLEDFNMISKQKMYDTEVVYHQNIKESKDDAARKVTNAFWYPPLCIHASNQAMMDFSAKNPSTDRLK